MRFLSLLFLIGLLAAIACKSQAPKTTYIEPLSTSFWYYQADFQLSDHRSALSSSSLYFRIVKADAFGELYKMFRFYEDGLVITYIVYNTPDKIIGQAREKVGNIHGYYTVKSDSLFFTTKVYYNHDATFYQGEVFTDSLVLKQINYKSKQEALHTYYRYQE